MSVTKTIGTFGKFLGHYAGEVGGIATALATIVAALPIGREEKAKVSEIVGDLAKASQNVAHSLNDLSGDLGAITVKKSDVEAAVFKFLGSDVGKAIISAVIAEQAANAGNANNG